MKCNKCGKEMTKRKGKYGEFWGCTGYPECKNTEQVVEKGPFKPMSHKPEPNQGKKQTRTDNQIAEDSVVLKNVKDLIKKCEETILAVHKMEKTLDIIKDNLDKGEKNEDTLEPTPDVVF